MISKEDAKHIAHLSRIELADGELIKIGNDLSAIVEYVKKLNEVDTKDIALLNGGSDAVNEMRKDSETKEQKELSAPESVARLVNAAPAREKGYIKVKSVF